MRNVRTYDADFNAMDIKDVFAELRKVRGNLLARLEVMDEVAAARCAHHPRLDVPMRVCDMALFAAEHDDFHVAAVTELAGKLR